MKRNRDLWIIALLSIVITLSLTLGLWAASADEEIKLEKKDFPFLTQDITVTIIRDEPNIEILSPANMTFSETAVPLKFTFEEKPILVGYQLDDEAKKWFMIKDDQIAPVLNIDYTQSPSTSILDILLTLRVEGPYKEVLLKSLKNESGNLYAIFWILNFSEISRIENRSSTGDPALKIGTDLKLFEGYVIYPLRFYFSTEAMEGAISKESDFIDLIDENVFEFTIENVTPGEHELTVYVIDKEGVETSAKTIFSVVEPDLIIMANSIDYANALDLMEYLNDSVIKPLRVTADSFEDYKNYSSILVLGGPDAPEGVGDIVRDVLETDEEESIRSSGARKMYVKTDVWVDGQKVIFIAGSNRMMTKNAHEENRNNIISVLNPEAQISEDEARSYLIQKYTPGICFGMPTLYDDPSQFPEPVIILTKTSNKSFNFRLEDGKCCTIHIFNGVVELKGATITDKIIDSNTLNVPC